MPGFSGNNEPEESSSFLRVGQSFRKAPLGPGVYSETLVDALWSSALRLRTGSTVRIRGQGYEGHDYPEGPPAFFLNIWAGNGKDRLLHLNPRKGQGVVVVNHFFEGEWGSQRASPLPDAWKDPRQPFVLDLLLDAKEWRVKLNGGQLPELEWKRHGNFSEEVEVEVVHVKDPEILVRSEKNR